MEEEAKEPKEVDAPPNNKDITLISADKKSFTIPQTTAFLSNFIKVTCSYDPDATEIPLTLINSDCLGWIIGYMQTRGGIPGPLPACPLTENNVTNIDEIDSTFMAEMDGKNQLLFDIIHAANYLEMTGLVQLACAKVASLLRNKNPNEHFTILTKGTKYENWTAEDARKDQKLK